jgi:fumarate reductase subunit C
MRDNPFYTDYHPRWLRPHLSTYWWLERPAYFAFILREASCVFVAWSVIYLLLLVRAVSDGAAAYAAFLAWSAERPILLLNLATLGFLVFHAITFFDAAPRALVLHVRGRRVPGRVVAVSHYAGWAGVSLLIIWVLVALRG